MRIPEATVNASAARDKRQVTQSPEKAQLPELFSEVQHDETFKFLQEGSNPQAHHSSFSFSQLDIRVNAFSQTPVSWDDQHDNTFPLVNPKESSFLNLFDTKLHDNEREHTAAGQMQVDRMISDVSVDAFHQANVSPGTTNTSTKSPACEANVSSVPRGPPSSTKETLLTTQGNASQLSLHHLEAHTQAIEPILSPSLVESANFRAAAFNSKPIESKVPTLPLGAQAQQSPLSTSNENRAASPCSRQRPLADGASAGCNRPKPMLGGVPQTTSRLGPQRDVSAEARQRRHGGSLRRVLRRIARTSSGSQRVSVGDCNSHGSVRASPGTLEETRDRKRKMTEEEDEETLRKMRRVRNRESVEKCRAKQKQRLEKLEKEERERRDECIRMHEVAESIQSQWRVIAAEYKRVTGNDAGECPISIPFPIELPELTTMSTCDE